MGAVGIAGWLLLLLLLLLPAPRVTGARPCIRKDFGHGSQVCVCNATYCDTLDPLVLPAVGSYVKYESSKAGKRLERSEGRFQSSLHSPGLLLTLNISAMYQRVKGFGGSLSDAAAMNILKLSRPAQDNLLRSYFSECGIEYNLVRVPMACSDFSVRPYSYDDMPQDYELKHFRLADEDTKMKIPLLRRALAMSKRPLCLFASPWTAPAWMRSNGDVRGKGTLKGKAGDKYHKTWANYFIKFLDEYAKHNVTFWAVTAQNEPLAGLFTPPQAPTIAFTAEQQRDFIVQDLGPALARSSHRTQLLMLDDQRIYLPHWAKVVLGNATAARYVAGLAVHWYLDAIVPPGCSLEATHKLFPDHFLLYTEACTGFFMFRFAVSLGCWERGDHYSYSILTVMNHFVSGWTDWNLVLDLEGGPNWVKNFVDSPVIVDGSKDVFYKQPMFYHMGHFSGWGCTAAAAAFSASWSTWPSCAPTVPSSWWSSTGLAGMCRLESGILPWASSTPWLRPTPSRPTCGASSDGQGNAGGLRGSLSSSPNLSSIPQGGKQTLTQRWGSSPATGGSVRSWHQSLSGAAVSHPHLPPSPSHPHPPGSSRAALPHVAPSKLSRVWRAPSKAMTRSLRNAPLPSAFPLRARKSLGFPRRGGVGPGLPRGLRPPWPAGVSLFIPAAGASAAASP